MTWQQYCRFPYLKPEEAVPKSAELLQSSDDEQHRQNVDLRYHACEPTSRAMAGVLSPQPPPMGISTPQCACAILNEPAYGKNNSANGWDRIITRNKSPANDVEDTIPFHQQRNATNIKLKIKIYSSTSLMQSCTKRHIPIQKTAVHITIPFEEHNSSSMHAYITININCNAVAHWLNLSINEVEWQNERVTLGWRKTIFNVNHQQMLKKIML